MLPHSQKSTCKLFNKSAVIYFLYNRTVKSFSVKLKWWKQHLYDGYDIWCHFISCDLFFVTSVFSSSSTLSESAFVLFKVLNIFLYSIIDFVFNVCQRLVEKEIGVDILFTVGVFQHWHCPGVYPSRSQWPALITPCQYKT